MRTKIGHYEIVQELGRGGMGVVYKGFEPALNRFVAIKTLSESLAHDPSIVERFMREARSMAALNDPHIIQIYFVGEDQGQPFFAMEFVEGESLSQKLKREGRLPAQTACQILLQTAQGLTTAHDRGVIHRDIKPANLMITQRGLVKVADFGIALATRDFSKKLTSTGEFVGTPGYLSPEICMGKQIDQRSDIFSLGIVFFEMLTGRIPFNDASPLGLMLEVVQADIPDVRTLNDQVDANVHAILSRMVAKEPQHRYQHCDELVQDLVAIGTNAAAGSARPSSAQVLIPPGAAGPSGRQSIPSAVVPGPASGRAALAPSAATVVSSPSNPGPAPLAGTAQWLTPAPQAAAAQPSAPHPHYPPPPQPPPHPQHGQHGQGQPPARRSSMLPWLVAATLVMGGAGAAGWQFRDKLGFGPAASAVATTTTANPATVVASTPTATPPPASTSAPVASPPATTTAAIPVTPPDSTPDPAQPVTSGQPASAGFATANTSSSGSPAVATPATELAQVLEAPPVAPASAASDAAAQQQADTLAKIEAATAELERTRAEMEKLRNAQPAVAVAEPAPPTLSGPAPRAGLQQPQPKRNLERLGERVAANRTPGPLAQAAPIAAAGPPGGRVLVLGFGPPGAANAAQQVIASGLADAGFTIIDADMVAGASRMMGDRDPDLPGLARLAAGSRVDVIVVARVQITGTQQIEYYGQSSTLASSLVGIKAFAVNSRSVVGQWQESLTFTSLNEAENTREAVQLHVREMARKLGPYRGRG